MRGKLTAFSLAPVGPGITPAHAGKTCPPRPRRDTGRDHPRACGENFRGGGRMSREEGSPPRMRGKHRQPCRPCPQTGITPAHAGKTVETVVKLVKDGDHPRACGENANFRLRFRSVSGSPPRMRGKHVRGDKKRGAAGITPAHAGKTRRK